MLILFLEQPCGRLGARGHLVGDPCARKTIKGSKDPDGSLVHKNALSGRIGIQVRVKLAKKTQKHHTWSWVAESFSKWGAQVHVKKTTESLNR